MLFPKESKGRERRENFFFKFQKKMFTAKPVSRFLVRHPMMMNKMGKQCISEMMKQQQQQHGKWLKGFFKEFGS